MNISIRDFSCRAGHFDPALASGATRGSWTYTTRSYHLILLDRTLSPELLILDEVGAFEAKALASLVSFGVRTVASVHGESAVEILRAPALASLLHTGLFSHLWDVKGGRAFPIKEGGCI